MKFILNEYEFYPTPEPLIRRMWGKIPENSLSEIDYILDPSAGKGNIVDFIQDERRRYRQHTFHAIEKDPQLCAILREKDIQVIDYDFLTYSGADKYDLIIMNPPFSNGDEHLLKALDIMYSGYVVCLLNAETLKNPYSNSRKILIQRLNELNADIEYIRDAFKCAERKTDVEVALVYVHIDRKIEHDMFDGVKSIRDRFISESDIHENALVTGGRIKAIVQEYNHVVEIVTKTLFDFYKNREAVKEFMDVVINGTENPSNLRSIDRKDLTKHVQAKLNTALKNIRVAYWRKVLTLDKVEERMTKKKLDEFNVQLQKNTLMDFTESNIRTFILNLISNYESIMMASVLALFDKLTISHAYGEDLQTKNIHYFNGWKTNKAFYVNKKVIVPMPYGAFADSYNKNKWKLGWNFDLRWIMGDFDKVCNFLMAVTSMCAYMTPFQKPLRGGNIPALIQRTSLQPVTKREPCT